MDTGEPLGRSKQALHAGLDPFPFEGAVSVETPARSPRAAPARPPDAGPGSLLAFNLRGGVEAGRRLLDAVKLLTPAVSLGGIESLIQHPASMTHASVPAEALRQA